MLNLSEKVEIIFKLFFLDLCSVLSKTKRRLRKLGALQLLIVMAWEQYYVAGNKIQCSELFARNCHLIIKWIHFRRSLRLAAIAAHNRYATPNANIEPNSVPEGDSENSDEAPQPPPRNVRRIGLPTYPEELEDEPVNDRRRMVRFRISRIDPDATSANPGSGDMSRWIELPVVDELSYNNITDIKILKVLWSLIS